VTSKVAKVADAALHYVDGRHGEETVQYNGTAVVMKKFNMDANLNITFNADADIIDDKSDIEGKNITVQLVSSEIDPKTGKPAVSSEVVFERWDETSDTAGDHLKFKLQFAVPRKFGVPVAILVKNQHPNEFKLLEFTLDLPDTKKDAKYWTNSWVSNTGNSEGRVFFLNKACLPCDTPPALKEFREKELLELRNHDKREGVRHPNDRIYDYDVYNDLGNPDKNATLMRRPLGGSKERPFPRRMRTGRAPTATSPECESPEPLGSFYVPRDETFDPIKARDQGADRMRGGLHARAAAPVTPADGLNFANIEGIKNAYAKEGRYRDPLFPLPQVLHNDSTAWQSDAEFAREFLAGLNPLEIKLVKDFPIKSKLSTSEFGNPESAIKAEHIEARLDGLSVQQAVSKKKLFVVDYHDMYLPLVNQINAQPSFKTYASRTLLFKNDDDTLKVLAIELVLPPGHDGNPEKDARVFTPPPNSSRKDYVWELAKAHVMSNEMAVHQVVSHFGRSHAMAEPVIIAANRQLSKMHPIHQLMLPHFKYTFLINATARQTLIGAGGAFEAVFTPGEHFLELVLSYYKNVWNFEGQALPEDLLSRGMAVPDSKAKSGVKLLVNDYPYAADGLELWDAMKTWNKEYVNIYYKDDAAVLADNELQSWWTEFRNEGHKDKKDDAGWYNMQSKADLVQILTIMQWLCSCQHAAINYSQYDYGSFMPQRPTKTRRLIPKKGDKEWAELEENPEKFFLSTVSDKPSALQVMAVFELTSNHTTEEEYIADRPDGWTQNDKVLSAFERYKSRLTEIDENINNRNNDSKLKNRRGNAGQLPYELLRPSSSPGLTSRGIPNSVTV